jgi:hypothetical protein
MTSRAMISVEKLFFDESGYTGEDLLNYEQPTFAYASTTLPDSDAASLVNSCFAFSRASELKHSRLSKSSRGQDAIVAFIQRILELSLPVNVFLAHKEYALLTYFIDFPVEEIFHRAGKDFFERGFNIALSNAAFYGLRPSDAPDVLTPLLRNFQDLYNSREYADWVKLCNGIEESCHKYDQYKKLMSLFLAACRILRHEYFRDMQPHTCDLAFTTFLAIAMDWSERTSCQFDVIHDTSSQLAKQEWLWSAVFSKDMAPFVHRKFDTTTTFPLKVREVRFAQSQYYHQLQVCDVVAGATRAWADNICIKNYNKKDYAERLEAVEIEKLLTRTMWPNTAVTPEELGTKDYERDDLLDYLTHQLGKILSS